jgi:hypothetical protein
MNRTLRLTAGSPRPTASRPRLLASALALAVALWTVAATPSARAATTGIAKLTITGVTVKSTTGDAKITVTGRVKLAVNTARQRKRIEVYLTLSSDTGGTTKTESFSARLTSKDSFVATHTTNLTGALGLDALVRIGGKQLGRKVVRTVSVTALASPGTGTGASTPGASTPGSSSAPGSPSTQGTQLNGTFELEAGAQGVSGAFSGTYFRMLGIINNNSTALNQEYTLLRPGTDGGLETFAYQEPPVPAFAGFKPGTDEYTGNALADRIVQPQVFFEIDFSIVTAPTDLQEGLPDPLPVIIDTAGKLSGQITDWEAQWNGLSFNQGSPKPGGTLPGSTTPLTGSYDAATGRYVLEWKSLIIGGPFNGQTGEWHLEGEFVPEA